MADPNDNMDDAMMDIINTSGNQYAEFEVDDNNQDVDDGSQYIADFEDEQDNIVQDNAGEVYLQSLMHT
jgi:hypothetical protein